MKGVRVLVNKGQVFGRLTIVEELASVKGRRMFLCMCACGKEKIAYLTSMLSGDTKSCGCLAKENLEIGRRMSSRGVIKKEFCVSKQPLYVTWASIKTRCYNPNCKAYGRYGGRGILMCDEWKNDFMSFYDWAIANGWSKQLEIDREDNNGHYEPSNCRFVSRKKNTNNREVTVMVVYREQSYPLREICEQLGLTPDTIYARMSRHGYSFEEAISISWNRKSRGEKAHRSKLTEAQVQEMRGLYSAQPKEYPTRKLAKKYGISQAAVFYILKGINWKQD